MYRRCGSGIPRVAFQMALCGVSLGAFLGCSPESIVVGPPVDTDGGGTDIGRPPQDIPPLFSDRFVPRDIPPIPIRDASGDGGAPTGDTGVPGDRTGPPDAGAPRCGAGIDSDGDGINNDEECRLGTDPFNRDTDMDNIPDGEERRYPRVCVAMTASAQRRPPQVCTADADCRAGERCTGLDPTRSDTDGDTVPDGIEDPNRDGRIEPARGETDPRIGDTDGDGRSDSMGGIEICRPSGLATVTQLGLPGAQVQLGYDPRWGTARRVPGTMNRRGVVLEDPSVNVAAGVFNYPTTGDMRAEATRAETIVTGSLGGGTTPVLIGRAFTSHEMNEAVTSTYRVARASSASTLRDAVAAAMTGVPSPAGMNVGTSSEFLVDVTTVRRTMGMLGVGTTDVVVTVAPRADYEDPTRLTAIRANDLLNATGVAQLDRGLGANCQVFRADRVPSADFIWTVDTSGSMSDDQERLGRTAATFFTRMRSAGVDFRVGVVNAGSTSLNIDSPGFSWIPGTDPNGANTLCQTVTTGRCPTTPSDSLVPYPFGGSSEEPTAAAIIAHDLFSRRAAMGETNLNRRFRPGVRVVTFHVTDEPGSNDFTRYFTRATDPQSGRPFGSTYNATTLNNIIDYFRRNSILTFGLVPRSATPCASANVVDLPRCVIEGNRGAVIPIETANDAEVSAAMMRIVEAIAGAASQFVLERTPITSTLKVRVRGMDVPRSRSSGFDYDGASRAIVFYGEAFRPRMGDEVVVSYRIWQPCPPPGATCVSDNDCCAPTTCREGRCMAPCRPTGDMCTADADCCAPNACMGGRCMPRPMCVPRDGACRPSELSNECCPPLVCIEGRCTDCRPTDAMCTRASDCCSNVCMNGRCACRPTGGRCTSPIDCCSRYCVDGLCGPG